MISAKLEKVTALAERVGLLDDRLLHPRAKSDRQGHCSLRIEHRVLTLRRWRYRCDAFELHRHQAQYGGRSSVCAVPLLEAPILKEMRFSTPVLPGEIIEPMPKAQLPAPSCGDRGR